MLTVGDAGSQAVAIAKDLLHLCDTKVLLGQDDQIGDELSDLLGLDPMAERIVTDWATAGQGPGAVAGRQRTSRRCRPSAPRIDVALTDTNDAHRRRRRGGGVADGQLGRRDMAATIGGAGVLALPPAGGVRRPSPARRAGDQRRELDRSLRRRRHRTDRRHGHAGRRPDGPRPHHRHGHREPAATCPRRRSSPSTTAYTESKLRNSTVQTDHDSEGLFQQRVSIYTEAVADRPGQGHQRLPRPAHRRYRTGTPSPSARSSADRPAVRLPRAVCSPTSHWPSSWSASSGPPPHRRRSSPARSHAGGAARLRRRHRAVDLRRSGGAVPAGHIVGPYGNNVAGTTTIPAGLVINGSPQGTTAVQYALAQLGKPYVWAAAGPDAFDCSGLTMAAWAAAGVALPHSRPPPRPRSGVPSPTNLSQAVAGDLVIIPGADGTAARPATSAWSPATSTQPTAATSTSIQAPETGIPVELTEATHWQGQIVAVRHIG